ncbi:MAG: dienelactone hydrolase family protein, partial [Rhodoglobus sp.]
TLKGAAVKLELALAEASIVHDIAEYRTASHTFMNEAPAGPTWFRPLARAMGFSPEPQAAADAWRRIDEFFRTHLPESTP